MNFINVFRTPSSGFGVGFGVTWVFVVALFGGCVSVNIGPAKTEKSEGVKLKAPARPFEKFEARGADQAWKSQSSGNLISYLSTCNDPADPSLETIQAELLAALEDVRVLRTSDRDFNGRRALNSEAEGLIDGVKTRLELLAFKKNNCTYSLTYLGLASRFDEERAQFQAFMNSFEAP